MRKLLSFVAVGVVAVGISACGNSSSDSALSEDAKAGQSYVSSNCSGCHSVDGKSRSGPTFKGLAGSSVELQNGTTVTADTAYLVKSIRDPAADVVKGFPNVMGAVVSKDSISEQQAQQIAAYIETLR